MQILMWLVFVALTPSIGLAAECTHTYTVGVLTDSPYYAQKPRVATTGMVADLLAEIRKRLGCRFQELPLNYVRAHEEFKGLRLDLFAFSYLNPAWLDVAEHKVLYSTDRVLLVKKSLYKKSHKVSDYIQNPKIKFGNMIGTVMFFLPTEFQKLSKENRIVQSPTADGVMNLVKSGRAQAVFVTPIYLRFVMSQPDFKDVFESIQDPGVSLDIGLYLSKKRLSKEENSQIKKIVDDMKSDGTIKSILGNYLPPAHQKPYN